MLAEVAEVAEAGEVGEVGASLPAGPMGSQDGAVGKVGFGGGGVGTSMSLIRGRTTGVAGLLPTTSHSIFYGRVGQIAIFSHWQP